MRITNGIMMNNTLNNINNNKLLLDKLNTQLSSQKKIQRPSEDPIIAIRALRYRSTLSEIDQYLEKNIPDARSWMSVTQDALENTVGMLEDIVYYTTQGANGTNDLSDRETVINTLKQYRDQIYSDANADYAGRSIFTGYKTDSKLTFTSNEPNTKYSITQKFTINNIENIKTLINTVDVSNVNANNINTVDLTDYETPVNQSVYRLRLGYDSISTDDLKITLTNSVTNTTKDLTVNMVNSSDSDAYNPVAGGVNFLSDTGEFIFSKEAYADTSNYDGISVDYVKNGFDKGELRPEHFFTCKDITNTANIIEYTTKPQDINYSINFNQDIKVNTQPDEVYNHSMTRDIDDLINSVTNVSNVEGKLEKLNNLLKNEPEGSDNYKKLETLISLTNRELDFAKENMQKKFESSLTSFQGHQERVSLAKSDVGARLLRLDMNETRLESQKITVADLKSKNESVVLTDIAVEISSASEVYDASLSAAAKVIKNTLLDFI